MLFALRFTRSRIRYVVSPAIEQYAIRTKAGVAIAVVVDLPYIDDYVGRIRVVDVGSRP